MKVAVYRIPGKTHEDHLTAMARGIAASGDTFEYFQSSPCVDADACVVWGWRVGKRVSEVSGLPVLVMERGYIGDRMRVWTSLGWDGLNGHARFNGVWDKDRFARHFSADLKPWREHSKGYALIMGQVLGDMSLSNVDIIAWYRTIATKLWKEGWDIKFRPHPESDRKGHNRPRVPFAEISEGTISDALSGAALVCAYNSNSMVDAVMAGVPIYAGDRGSMVYDLSGRDFNPIRPSREKRLNEIANCQWQIDEISSGKAWNIVREAM